MTTLKEKYSKLSEMLHSYFHEDSTSFFDGASELLSAPTEPLQKYFEDVALFINSELEQAEEKGAFIEYHVRLSFDRAGLDPLSWLQDLKLKIEQELEKRK